MNKTKYHWAILPVLLVLCSCMKEPVSTERSSNNEFKVDLLFENNGVKVYRFFDGGRAIYYTDARGRTEWTTTHSNGKVTTTHKRSVETVE